MKPLETTVEEVLRKAIQSEIETRVYFQKMAERAGSPEVRNRMQQLADAELVHRAKLERRYRDRIGKPAPEPEEVRIDLPPELVNLDMAHALKHALERERDSESYFRFMAERVPPESDLGKLFWELAETEWKHKTDLQAEYDRTVSDRPDQFLLDM
ncbi:MAG TPA: ferritin family protein [Thermoanaerobaculia bacterium]